MHFADSLGCERWGWDAESIFIKSSCSFMDSTASFLNIWHLFGPELGCEVPPKAPKHCCQACKVEFRHRVEELDGF